VHEIVANELRMNNEKISHEEVYLAGISGGLNGIVEYGNKKRILKNRQENLYTEIDKREQKYSKKEEYPLQ